MLTDAQKAKYIQNSGACPYCGSESYEKLGNPDYQLDKNMVYRTEEAV